MPPKKGQYYYVTDTRCIYKDMNDEPTGRKRVSAVILNSDYERLNVVRPENGQNYYVIDNNSLWEFDTKWKLKMGSVDMYNSYTYTSGQTLSPVIHTDPLISTPTGDKVIDNNGLLENGSVVVRDSNRINRGIIGADLPNSVLAVTSFLDNGIVFYPYGMGSSIEEQQRIGSLHLGVDAVSEQDKKMSLFDEAMTHIGRADYKGNFYVYGRLCIVDPVSSDKFSIFDVPTEDQQMYHSFTCSRKAEYEDGSQTLYYNYVVVRVLSATKARIRVITYTNAGKSAVIDDNGEPLYSTPTVLESDIEYDATRGVASLDTPYGVTYIADGPGFAFMLSGSPESSQVQFEDEFLTNSTDPVFATTQLHNIKDVDKMLTELTELLKKATSSQ